MLCFNGFCRLLINFANSLDPDHAQQNFGPDLDLSCLILKKSADGKPLRQDKELNKKKKKGHAVDHYLKGPTKRRA